MTRWLIEKSGTGIEKSGTGIEKSGTGIEKSGTGIEKSGTGIEKSGTGIRKGLFACSLAVMTFASSVHAGGVSPNGELSLYAENGRLAVSWAIDGSLFGGVALLDNGYSSLTLTEITLAIPSDSQMDVVGGGTGSKAKVVGGGTGSEVVGGGTGSRTKVVGGGTGGSTEVVGGGTGSSSEVVGGGTGSSADVVGGGTGSDTDVVGGGTGSDADVVGGGTGSDSDVVGGGTGSNAKVVGGGTGGSTLVVGGGTGSEAIAITLPGENSLRMEVAMDCGYATVYVLDSEGYDVVSFDHVKVKGDTTQSCNVADTGFSDATIKLPGRSQDGRY